MGTPTRDREPCKACESEYSARKFTDSTLEQRAAGAPNRDYVVFCEGCGSEASPELTPDDAFASWDKLNRKS